MAEESVRSLVGEAAGSLRTRGPVAGRRCSTSDGARVGSSRAQLIVAPNPTAEQG